MRCGVDFSRWGRATTNRREVALGNQQTFLLQLAWEIRVDFGRKLDRAVKRGSNAYAHVEVPSEGIS